MIAAELVQRVGSEHRHRAPEVAARCLIVQVLRASIRTWQTPPSSGTPPGERAMSSSAATRQAALSPSAWLVACQLLSWSISWVPRRSAAQVWKIPLVPSSMNLVHPSDACPKVCLQYDVHDVQAGFGELETPRRGGCPAKDPVTLGLGLHLLWPGLTICYPPIPLSLLPRSERPFLSCSVPSGRRVQQVMGAEAGVGRLGWRLQAAAAESPGGSSCGQSLAVFSLLWMPCQTLCRRLDPAGGLPSCSPAAEVFQGLQASRGLPGERPGRCSSWRLRRRIAFCLAPFRPAAAPVQTRGAGGLVLAEAGRAWRGLTIIARRVPRHVCLCWASALPEALQR